jgi:hypothetical protein
MLFVSLVAERQGSGDGEHAPLLRRSTCSPSPGPPCWARSGTDACPETRPVLSLPLPSVWGQDAGCPTPPVTSCGGQPVDSRAMGQAGTRPVTRPQAPRNARRPSPCASAAHPRHPRTTLATPRGGHATRDALDPARAPPRCHRAGPAGAGGSVVTTPPHLGTPACRWTAPLSAMASAQRGDEHAPQRRAGCGHRTPRRGRPGRAVWSPGAAPAAALHTPATPAAACGPVRPRSTGCPGAGCGTAALVTPASCRTTTPPRPGQRQSQAAGWLPSSTHRGGAPHKPCAAGPPALVPRGRRVCCRPQPLYAGQRMIA